MTLSRKDNLCHLGLAAALVNELETQVAPLADPNKTAANLIVETAADNLVATGANQAGALALTAQTSRFTTVAAGTGALLPASLAGLEITIINHGANPLTVYPSLAASDAAATIDDVATATGVQIMPNSVVLFWCPSAGLWYTEGLATGYYNASGVGGAAFQTFSSQTGVVAHAGGGQANATQVVAMQVQVSTVASAGDSIKLPPSQAGLELVIVNNGANSMNVFPATGEQINGGGANAAVAQAAAAVTFYMCFVSGSWVTK